MNWAFKIAAKFILSRAPVNYGTFRRIGMFRHGRMHKPAYATGVFFNHMNRVGGRDAFRDKTCLELGPGDSLASAILAHAVGAKRIYLVDVGAFADMSLPVYSALIGELIGDGHPLADLENFTGIDDLLHRTSATYFTEGLGSFAKIPSGSVDVIWSQAVLEHIRVQEVPALLKEMRRIMSPTGVMSHRIDYKDHLGGGLNNMRLPSKLWETEMMAKSGFYTNRIRNSEFIKLIEQAGFDVKLNELGTWETAPLPRHKMAAEFRLLSDADLRTKSLDIVATPALR